MSDLVFSMGVIRDCPESQELVDAYHAEMDRRGIPTTWPRSDLVSQACLIYRNVPLTLVMFAALHLERDRDSPGDNIYVAGAYTRPSWRRCGLYSDILGITINEWRLQGSFEWLRGGFHKSNWVSEAMQRKQGREFYEVSGDHQRTRLSLRPTGEEYELTSATLQPILDRLDSLAG